MTKAQLAVASLTRLVPLGSLIACLASLHPYLHAESLSQARLVLSVTPTHQYAPGTVQLTAKVSPNEVNRR